MRLHHAIDALALQVSGQAAAWAWVAPLTPLLANALVGVVAGALVLAVTRLGNRLQTGCAGCPEPQTSGSVGSS